MTELPQNQEAEQAVLGSLLIDRDAIAQIADWLEPEAFHGTFNRRVYQAILWLWKRRVPCDLVTLCDELTKVNRLDQVGGAAYLSELLSGTPTAAHIGYYAEIVNEKARLRSLIQAGTDLVQAGYAPGQEPDYDELLAEARRKIGRFEAKSNPVELGISSLVETVRDQAFRRWDGEISEAISTGIADIDKMTDGGMRCRQLWVLAARPSMGKTALMLHMARRCRSLVFSLEMPMEQVLQRMVAAEANVPYSVATSVVGDVAQRDRWLRASEVIEKLPIQIIDSPAITTAKIQAITSRAVAEQGVQAVFIDHMSYLSDQFRHNNEQEKVGELARRCKFIADICDVPVVLLSQLNREAEGRPGCMPHMSDLRSSGRIEEDAYFVGLIYRRLYYVGRGMIEPNNELDWVRHSPFQQVQVIVAKNRNGEVGTAHLAWDPPSMKFREVWETAA